MISSLLNTTPDEIYHVAYGWVFHYGAKVVEQETGTVYLFDSGAARILNCVPSPYCVRFRVVNAVDIRDNKKIPFVGYMPLEKRELSRDEIVYFERLKNMQQLKVVV